MTASSLIGMVENAQEHLLYLTHPQSLVVLGFDHDFCVDILFTSS
jgi:hypothetical protein